MRTLMITGILCAALFSAGSRLWALDTGLLDHYLNVNLDLPTLARACAPETAREAVATHVRDVMTNSAYRRGPRCQYWQDYRQVLKKFREISRALPVFVGTAEAPTELVARYLVGFVSEDTVYGFVAVDPLDGHLQAKLMWNDDLEPLWQVSRERWQGARSVNELAELAELIPPYAQFTTGIPVDVTSDDYALVDGVLDLPYKTQEERTSWCEWFNERHGTALDLTLNHTLGRRTATSKCLSVAISYIADWWTVRTDGSLPSYSNAAGGQREYGFNPRLCETLYFKSAIAEAGLAERMLLRLGSLLGVGVSGFGQFKLVGRDRVTGEPIAYSPRGYARVLAECRQALTPDPLVPTLLTYETRDNHFSMDQPPMPIVLDENFLARVTEARDAKDFGDDERYSLSPWAGRSLTATEKEAMLVTALETWGPLYAQHMKRAASGEAATGLLASGVHACVMVGHGSYRGRHHFVYRETFGEASPRYLEDSFLGPSYRIMPSEYFWQVIAFPHHLYVDLDLSDAGQETIAGTVTITTNRGSTPLNVDGIVFLVDGVHRRGRLVPLERGQYEFTLEKGSGKRLEVRVARRYFADRLGRNAFGRGALLTEQGWTVDEAALTPIDGSALGFIR